MSSYISTSALYYPNESYLSHHGIKGQRWGVRRYQNEDGTLTQAGRDRYLIGQAKEQLKSEKKAYRKEHREYLRKVNYGFIAYNPQMYAKGSDAQKRYKKALREDISARFRLKAAKNEYKFAKEDAHNSKILELVNSRKRNSKYFQKYEKEYLDRGMGPDEAKIAAFKKERSIRIAQLAAATTLVAASAYAASRYYDSSVDKFLDSSVELKRVSSTSDAAVHDGFYASLSKNKLDVTKYSGNYARELGGFGYQKTIDIGKSGLKLASEKSGTDALRKVIDSSSAYEIQELKNDLYVAARAFSAYGRQGNAKACSKAYDALAKGTVNKDLYKGLVSAAGILYKDTSVPSFSRFREKLFTQLKSDGYDAIQDVNDKYFSGYKAKMPIIVLDASKVTVKSVRELSTDEVTRNLLISTGAILTQKIAPTIVGSGAAYLGLKSLKKTSRSKKEAAFVDKYIKQHPDTKKTYTEIARLYGKYL